jgi:ribulose-phosphate 3-epimerase
MIEIIPSILSSDPNEARALLSRLEGKVKRAQVDIVDGVFSANKTIDPSALASVETDVLLDFHLMVNEPIHWIEKAVSAMADRIIGQIEMMSDQVAFVGKVQETGRLVGLAIDINTPVDALDPVVLTNLDIVLVMSVKAGFGGQDFEEEALAKIKALNDIRLNDNTPFRICEDGGITLEYIDDVRREGVDEVVIGRRIFEGEIEENIDKFTRAAYGRE